MTSHRTGTGTVVGSLRASDGKAVVRMEDHIDTDVHDLWSALTDPQRLARWKRGLRDTPLTQGTSPERLYRVECAADLLTRD